MKKICKSLLCLGLFVSIISCSNQPSDIQNPSKESETTESTSSKGIQSVKAIGFMDNDGAKLKAIAIEYSCDLVGADIREDTYRIQVNKPSELDYLGDGEIGDIEKMYINSEAVTTETPTGNGKYVIVEMFSDWLASAELKLSNSLNAKVTQIKDIHCNSGTIPARETLFGTVSGSKKIVDFSMNDIEGFKYYSDTVDGYDVDGEAFHVKNCYSMISGEYQDESLAYALWVPKDYNENGNYALVTIDNPATTKGSHPMKSVLETRSPALFASDWAQEQVKKNHNLDGLIVLVPVITERVNDNGGTPAEYEALVKLWDHIIDTYHVDENYIYGVGQSVGGMELIETNRNRDNFFAGIIMYEDQWGQNYCIDTTFARDMAANSITESTAPMHYPRVDASITYDYSYDSYGNKVYEGHDPYNFYYLVSDDNILALHNDSSSLSVDCWNEMKYLYKDLADCEMNYLNMDASQSLDSQNTLLEEYLSDNESRNIKSVTYFNGTSGYSCRKSDSTYKWLLNQTRQSEMKREKLDLNKPFSISENQIQNEERTLHFTAKDGSKAYFLTGKKGCGTQFYNSCWLNLSKIADALPGWLPEGMSWDKGVKGASIESVRQISNTALAIKFNADMSHLVSRLKGDKVTSYFGNEREDLILFDPYMLYDSERKLIANKISNIYVNESASIVLNAGRDTGNGSYVILEFENEFSSSCNYVMQRTTLWTDSVIATPSSTLYEVTK